MRNNKKYWKGIAELEGDSNIEKLAHNEFSEELPLDDFLSDNLSSTSTSRRDFLKFLGFSTAAATLAACETPVVKSIPYVIKPEEIIPGVANYYATSIYDGRDYASVLVKNREGRPIKIESNKTCTNARVQASVLSLYDSGRLKYPLKNGRQAEWSSLDIEIKEHLSKIKKKIVLLTGTILSPSIRNIVNDFSRKYSNVEHIMYDAIPYDGILDANKKSFGLRVIPSYHFDISNVIVSFGADFIGNWLNNDYSTDYIKGRNPKAGKMSKHYQIETNLSLSGSNADERIAIRPSEQKILLTDIYKSLSSGSSPNDNRLKKIVESLRSNKGSGIVVCDSNDMNTQLIVNAINSILGNYDNTISLRTPSYIKQGDTQRVNNLIQEMQDGDVGALITYKVNPSYNLVNAKEFNKALSKVDLTISTSLYNDETASLMNYVCPDNHNLESWGDVHPSHNVYTLMQPTIAPLFNTRQFEETLLRWIDRQDYHTYLSNFWREKGVSWEEAVHDGFFTLNDIEEEIKLITPLDANVLSSDKRSFKGIELALYEKIGIGDGKQANNPWLQEFPDPISRACWDNYMTISATTARKLGLKNWNVSNGGLNGSVVNIRTEDKILKDVPVMIQPGQANNTVGIALGYGREKAGKAANNVGVNAFSLLRSKLVTIEKINGEHEFASIQLHHTMMGRDIVKETTLSNYIKDPSSGNKRVTYPTFKGVLPADKLSLYDEQDLKTGHFWNLSIDLTSCTGCGECVISCQAENNVPVVGKEEVRKSRDMHWMRIDRYYSSDMTKEVASENDISSIEMYKDMEEPSDNPEVVFQPVMCQHCNNAPCENVCPVAATTHSNEGLNQMTYNRCVGTRYCANNCPYKVRRFNWFQYSDNDKFDFNMNDDYGKMVLNPDVVVRSRGVIEKCSMCIQKIQELKLTAKKEGRPILDEEAQTVCASSCATNAIVFGDANNKDSEVSKLKKDERAYDLLDHLNVNPSVFYQTKVRNKS